MRRLPLLLPFLLLALSSTAAKEREEEAFLRGICYTSHEFQNESEKDLVAWVTENRVNLVAVDFFLVNHGYGWTKLDEIARRVKRLKEEGVTVLADYRPSTSEPGVASPGDQPDLCLSTPEVRANIIGWGLHILEKVPGIDILTIYNPMPRFERNQDCAECKRIGETALLELFFAEWSRAIREKHPDVKLGAVFVAGESIYGPIREHLDVFCPFCSVVAERDAESAGPGVMRKVASDMRRFREHGPIIPLVKLYWKEATKNTTEDVLHAMQEAKEEKLDGFFLWYRSLLTGEVDRNTPFDLPDYDLARIEAKYRELAEPLGYPALLPGMRARHLDLLRVLSDSQVEHLEGGKAEGVLAAARALLAELRKQKETLDDLRAPKEHRKLFNAHRKILATAIRELARFERAAARDAREAALEHLILAAGDPRDQLALLRERPEDEIAGEDAWRLEEVARALLKRAQDAEDGSQARRLAKEVEKAVAFGEAVAEVSEGD